MEDVEQRTPEEPDLRTTLCTVRALQEPILTLACTMDTMLLKSSITSHNHGGTVVQAFGSRDGCGMAGGGDCMQWSLVAPERPPWPPQNNRQIALPGCLHADVLAGGKNRRRNRIRTL